MRKPGKGAIHRSRHEGDGIGREGCVREVFHARVSAEFEERSRRSRFINSVKRGDGRPGFRSGSVLILSPISRQMAVQWMLPI